MSSKLQKSRSQTVNNLNNLNQLQNNNITINTQTQMMKQPMYIQPIQLCSSASNKYSSATY